MTPSTSTNLDVKRGLFGLVFIVVGVLVLLGQLDVLPRINPWRYFGPGVLIAIGLGRMWGPSQETRRRGGGLWLVALGVWLALAQLDVLPVKRAWPLLLVALGLSIVWKAARDGRSEGARR